MMICTVVQKLNCGTIDHNIHSANHRMKPNKAGYTYSSNTRKIKEKAKLRASEKERKTKRSRRSGGGEGGTKRATGIACILNHTYRTTETVNKSFTIVPITRPRATTIVHRRCIGTKHASDTKRHVYA